MPSPDQGEVEVCEEGDDLVEIPCNPNGTPCAFVFKTTADQYGRFSYFKVVAGSVKQDMTLLNHRMDATEKIGHLYSICGKKATEVKEITCGDIGAVSKLATTKTGDTLSMSVRAVNLTPVQFAKPCYTQAIAPENQGRRRKNRSGSHQALRMKIRPLALPSIRRRIRAC